MMKRVVLLFLFMTYCFQCNSQNQYVYMKLQKCIERGKVYQKNERKVSLDSTNLMSLNLFKVKGKALKKTNKNNLAFLHYNGELVGLLLVDRGGRSYVDMNYNCDYENLKESFLLVKKFGKYFFQIKKVSPKYIFFYDDKHNLYCFDIELVQYQYSCQCEVIAEKTLENLSFEYLKECAYTCDLNHLKQFYSSRKERYTKKKLQPVAYD